MYSSPKRQASILESNKFLPVRYKNDLPTHKSIIRKIACLDGKAEQKVSLQWQKNILMLSPSLHNIGVVAYYHSIVQNKSPFDYEIR